MFLRMEGSANRFIIAEDGQLIADFKNSSGLWRRRFAALALDQHHQDAGFRAQPGPGKADAPVLLRNMAKRHLDNGFRADIVHQHHCVEGFLALKYTVCQTTEKIVTPGMNLRHAHENENYSYRTQGDQKTGKLRPDLKDLQR